MSELRDCADYWSKTFLTHPCRIEYRSKIQEIDNYIVLAAIFWEHDEWPGTPDNEKGFCSSFCVKLSKLKYGTSRCMVQRLNSILANNFALLIQKCANKDPTMNFLDDDEK